MQFSRTLRIAIFTVMALIAAGFASPSHAQGTIGIKIVKAGWFIGGSAGNGTLQLRNRYYPLNIGGLSAGLVFGGSVTELVGEVHNIRRPSDINGVYTAVGAGVAVVGGVQMMQLQNANGVVLTLRGQKIGLEFNLDLSGMAISLQ